MVLVSPSGHRLMGLGSSMVVQVLRGLVPVTATAPIVKAEEAAIVPPPAGTAARTRRARVAKVHTPAQIAQALERVALIDVRPRAGNSKRGLLKHKTSTKMWTGGTAPVGTFLSDPGNKRLLEIVSSAAHVYMQFAKAFAVPGLPLALWIDGAGSTYFGSNGNREAQLRTGPSKPYHLAVGRGLVTSAIPC